jgi:hypothetical protein
MYMLAKGPAETLKSLVMTLIFDVLRTLQLYLSFYLYDSVGATWSLPKFTEEVLLWDGLS